MSMWAIGHRQMLGLARIGRGRELPMRLGGKRQLTFGLFRNGHPITQVMIDLYHLGVRAMAMLYF